MLVLHLQLYVITVSPLARLPKQFKTLSYYKSCIGNSDIFQSTAFVCLEHFLYQRKSNLPPIVLAWPQKSPRWEIYKPRQIKPISLAWPAAEEVKWENIVSSFVKSSEATLLRDKLCHEMLSRKVSSFFPKPYLRGWGGLIMCWCVGLWHC